MTRDHAKKILTHLRNGKSDLMLMDALDMAISALSADGEYIKKEDAINSTYFEPTYYDPLNVLTEARDKIKELRTYSFPDSENTGEWISTEDRPDGFCSKCDTDIYEASTPYCPYCGAKMTWVGAIRKPYKENDTWT